MSLNKLEETAGDSGYNNVLTVADLDSKDPNHGAKVTLIETIKGNKGDYQVVHLEFTSSELKGKTLNTYLDRFRDSANIVVGSKVVCHLSTNKNGYADCTGGRSKNYFVK